MKENFHDVVSKLLNEHLKRRLNAPLKESTHSEIYQDIFHTIVEIFKNAGASISNEAVNYVAQQYYDSVVINETIRLNPNIFTQRAKLGNIETKELALLAMMLRDSPFYDDVMCQLKKHR